MVDWETIDTVLLDMDGTLLDLHFDNHFWREHVPLRYAEHTGKPHPQAKEEVMGLAERIFGTLNWYCLDYWSDALGMDVAALKHEVDHLIRVHPQVPEFLGWVRAARRRVVLVTNAHGKSLALKLERTGLGESVDAVVCAHEFGLPKEYPAFWDHLQQREPFEPDRTLLVDDSPNVLRSAQGYGIAHLLAVRRPDTTEPPRDEGPFPAIDGFADLMTASDTPADAPGAWRSCTSR